MGRSSDWALEIAEENYRGQKEEWIKRELDDSDADENTEGWDALASQYDETYENWESYIEGEYEWHHSQDHSNFYISFIQTINEIKTILKSHIDPQVTHTTYKMLHVHVVTAMETYLGDSLKSTVLRNETYIANAAKNLDELTKRKFKLEDFISESDFVAKIVLQQLCKYLYHDVARVMVFYKATLDFHCAYNLKNIIEITTIRHDLVHRNGKDNDGNRVQINHPMLEASINEVEIFIKYLDENLREHHEG